jgi:hypothetical protein
MQLSPRYRLNVSTLRYRSNVCVSDLKVGECTIHRAGTADNARWWLLWFCVARVTDGRPMDAAVPINPNGSYVEAGPGGKTWGLTKTAVGTWQIAPSINVLGTRVVHPGTHPTEVSLWHETPTIVDVPDGETWQTDPP